MKVEKLHHIGSIVTAHNINTKKILFIVMKMLDWNCLIQEEAEKEVKEKYHTD